MSIQSAVIRFAIELAKAGVHDTQIEITLERTVYFQLVKEVLLQLHDNTGLTLEAPQTIGDEMRMRTLIGEFVFKKGDESGLHVV